MHYIDTTTGTYPLTLVELRRDNPLTVFFEPFTGDGRFALVEPSSPPAYDTATHRLAELAPIQEDGRWVQVWEIVPLTPEQIDAARQALVPQSCTRRQGRLALLQVGQLDAVESAIAAIDDPAQRRAAQIEYEADTWERVNPFLQAMWVQLGGTPAELDELFVLAVTL